LTVTPALPASSAAHRVRPVRGIGYMFVPGSSDDEKSMKIKHVNATSEQHEARRSDWIQARLLVDEASARFHDLVVNDVSHVYSHFGSGCGKLG